MLAGGAAWGAIKNFDASAIMFFAAVAFLSLCIGFFGKRKTVEVVFNAAADKLFQSVLDALF